MKSVLVIGLGRFGRHLAHKMAELGNDVMVVDKDAEIIAQVAAEFSDAQIGDCTNESVLRALAISHFDLCFVTIGEDFQSSLVITFLLKQYGAQRIVAKARQSIQADLLRQIGACEVIYPEREMAERIAIRYSARNIFDYIPLTGEYSIYEIPVLPAWIGRSVAEVNVRKKYNVNIVAIKNSNALQPVPGGDYIFCAADHIVVIARSADVSKLSAKT
ncbi:MAG: TrkA family potassium uptake protein [Oscillospiraceae bacterium]|nr:TrkA family potassium uptake protein [Oscillospiraceae bacterium]